MEGGRQSHRRELKPEDVARYAHSPVHYAVARGDYAGLRRVLSTLPRLPKAGEVTTEEESMLAEERADIVSGAIDRRDVPGRETPLHVAVRLGDADSVELLMGAGADWSLQNEHGWSALQEAVCAREDRIAMIMTRHYQPLAWSKWCRRLPRIMATAARMRDFYMEITFHFESSVIPFIGRIAPSDTYRIWKRGANLRADMTLAGFDGFRIQRSDQSFLFLGDGHDCAHGRVPPGSLLVLSHKDKEVSNALEGAGARPSDAEVAHEVTLMAQTNMYRPGIDVTQAELAPHLNWRRQERTEMVGSWKAKVYDMLHVSVSVKSRRVPGAMTDEELFAAENEGYGDVTTLTNHEKEQLDNALEYENCGSNEEKRNWFGWGAEKKTQNAHCNGNCSAKEEDDVEEEEEESSKIVKKFSRLGPESSSDGNGETPKKGKGKVSKSSSIKKDSSKKKRAGGGVEENKQESEYKKGLRPVLWLTRDFPLKTEEFLPLLDILANKVKAIRRMRELLTTKLPPGTFPVKVAIPIVPTIRVVITFTKYEELQPLEEFSTPLSSPVHFQEGKGKDVENSNSSGSWMSWMRGSHSRSSSEPTNLEDHLKDDSDPFSIPNDYTWVDLNEKKRRMKAKKSKNKKGKKHSSRNAEGSLSEIEE